MIVRYKVLISYDGSKFNGFQKLSNDCNTIQEKIERALKVIAKKDIYIKGSGRTDKGVHALNQCLHFDMEKIMSNKRFLFVLNNLVRPYINVISINIVANDFHARFSCQEKTYTYIINNGNYDLFRNNYSYYVRKKLNIKKMEEATKLFVGTHNFKNFACCKNDNYNLTINKATLRIKEKDIIISFRGKSFYTYMVRNMVGTIIMAGFNKINLEEIEDLLAGCDKRIEIVLAPSNGLYLTKIKY